MDLVDPERLWVGGRQFFHKSDLFLSLTSGVVCDLLLLAVQTVYGLHARISRAGARVGADWGVAGSAWRSHFLADARELHSPAAHGSGGDLLAHRIRYNLCAAGL